MRQRFKKKLVCVFLVCLQLCALTATGCGTALKDPVSVTGYYLNTYVSIKAYTTGGHSTQELQDILDEAVSLCGYYELMFSRTNPDSTLYKINSGETCDVPAELATVLLGGLEYADKSDGAFDITIGSVSSLWDFSGSNPVVPDKTLIDNALQSVDYNMVTLAKCDDGNYTISKPDGMIIDLGAVAKGYIADRIKTFLLDNKIDRAIIDLGGNILCVGAKQNSNFNVGIKKPFSEDGTPLVTLSLNDVSAVSSGNYERYFYEHDTLYHHILNPDTGYPYNNELSGVTIISKSSFVGDCLSTTCFSMGLEKGLDFINETPDAEAMFVTADGSIHYSEGFQAYVKKN